MRFTFYLNETCPHIDGLLNALALREDVESVTLVTDSAVSADRLALGWPSGFEGSYQHLLLTSAQQVRLYVAATPQNELHVFIGMRHVSCIVEGLKMCLRLQRPFGLMHEPRAGEGLAGKLRFLHSWLTEDRLRRHAIFILAIGEHGPAWFQRTGYQPERIFPFAYFVDRNCKPAINDVRNTRNSEITVGYAGRLVEQKGISDFLAALTLLPPTIQAVIVGSGDQAEYCRIAAEGEPRLTFKGVLPMREMQAHLSTIDVLVQPSHTTDDGWGVVVTEALLAGAAAITTNVVGASTCLKEGWRGRTVPIKSPRHIAEAILTLSADKAFTSAERIRRAAWADQHLTGAAGASNLMGIVRYAMQGAPRPPSFLDE